jgi:hypothetical protein
VSPVPTSCLYSLTDGVVPPQEATLDGNPKRMHENIRVLGSHSGLGFNAMVLAIVAERLAQPEGALAPVQARRLGGRGLSAGGGLKRRPARADRRPGHGAGQAAGLGNGQVGLSHRRGVVLSV